MKQLFTNRAGKLSLIKLLGWAVFVLLIVGGAVAAKTYYDVQRTLNQISQEATTTPTEHRDQAVDLTEGDPINVLLVGTDGADEGGRAEKEGYVSRSDTLMLVNLNPKTHQTRVLSIPRDALALVNGQPDKINHAFAYGGIDLTIKTVQDYLQVPIDYYAVINMSGLEHLVDAVGGIQATSPLTFEYQGSQFTQGQTYQMDGVTAMNFARMRYDDPQGEVGRQNRQKLVVRAIVDKILSADGIRHLPTILKAVGENVKTNVNLASLGDIYQQYLPALDTTTVVSFEQLEELYLNQVFYFGIPVTERVRVANEFRQGMQLQPVAVADMPDPLGEQRIRAEVKTLTMIVNQYPTGLTAEQRERINQRQAAVQAIRATDYTRPVEEEQTVRPTDPATGESRAHEATDGAGTAQPANGVTPATGATGTEQSIAPQTTAPADSVPAPAPTPAPAPAAPTPAPSAPATPNP